MLRARLLYLHAYIAWKNRSTHNGMYRRKIFYREIESREVIDEYSLLILRKLVATALQSGGEVL